MCVGMFPISRSHCCRATPGNNKNNNVMAGDPLAFIPEVFRSGDCDGRHALSLWRTRNSIHIQGYSGRKHASFCSHNVPQIKGLFSPAEWRSLQVWIKDHQIKTLSRPSQSPDMKKTWSLIMVKFNSCDHGGVHFIASADCI